MTGVATVGAVAAIRPSPAEPGDASRVSPVINVKDHGARGDGSADDTLAVKIALDRASSLESSSTLYFPSGVYRVSAGTLRVPDGHSTLIRGDGPGASRITFVEGETSSEPLVSLDALFSAVEDLQLDGTDAVGASDLLVLNRGYTRVSNCLLSNSPGTALAIGKEGRALAHIVQNVVVRDARGYGIRVHGATGKETTGSTDGLWSNVDVGRSGLSGVLLESSSQNLSNVHVWQSGVHADDPTDQNGFLVVTRSHIFAGCQAEKNHGDGFRFERGGGDGCVVSGSRIWENGGSGLVGVGAQRLTVTGSTFARNGRNNVGDSASPTDRSAAAIRNEGGDHWSITGCNAWDDETELDAVNVPPDSATPNIPARGRRMSQTFAYVESGEAGSSVISGGVLRAEDQLSGRAVQSASPFLRISATDLGEDTVPTVVAATSLNLPPWGEVIKVAGAAEISSVRPGRPGRTVTLIFTSDGAGLSGADPSLRLTTGFAPRAGGAITLVCLDDSWCEQSRTA